MSDTKRFRMGLWAVVFFVLVVTMPGWYVQMRTLEKVSRLERRIAELEAHTADLAEVPDQPAISNAAAARPAQ